MSRTSSAAVALAAVLPLVAVPAGSAAGAPGPVTEHRAAPHARDAQAPVRIVVETRRARADAGRTVRIRGRVSPRAAGNVLVLQKRLADQSRWRRVGDGRVRLDGDFVLRDLPTDGGHYLYRVVMPAADGLRRSVSNEVPLTVWTTTTLVGFVEGATAGVETDAVVHVGGDTRSSSIVLETAGGSGYVEYTLGRKCDGLSAQYALTDESETGASGTITATVDGRVVGSQPVGTGTLDIVFLDVRGAFRVRFDLQGSASPPGRPVVLSPYVHCAP